MDRLRLSINNKKICGLCGGIGEYFSIDPTVIRIIFILMLFLFKLEFIILYVVCWLIIPTSEED